MSKWNAMWGTAIGVTERYEGNYAKDLTLRYAMKCTLSGTKLRVRFSNICGSEPVTITKAFAAGYDGGSRTDAETAVALTFNGSKSGVIPPGGMIVSDEAEFRCEAGRDIAISMYFEGMTELMSGMATWGPCQDLWFANGDHAGAEELPRDMRKQTGTTFFLDTIDVFTDDAARSVVLFGDSITAQSWPDRLNLKLLENGRNIAAVRKAASGARLLGQYDCLQYAHYGLSGRNRFVRECDMAGADTVVVFQGINDIIHPDGINPWRPMSNFPTLDEMKEGYRYYINEAHRMGMRIILATLLPIGGWRTYEPFRDKLRAEVNEWIRTTEETDGCLDLDAALRDPANPCRLKPEYNSGDWLHPSGEGAQAIADTMYKLIGLNLY